MAPKETHEIDDVKYEPGSMLLDEYYIATDEYGREYHVKAPELIEQIDGREDEVEAVVEETEPAGIGESRSSIVDVIFG